MGQIETLIACYPSADGQTVLPCPTGTAPTTISAYVLNADSAQQMQALMQPVNFQQAALIGTIGFGLVISYAAIPLAFRVIRKIIKSSQRN